MNGFFDPVQPSGAEILTDKTCQSDAVGKSGKIKDTFHLGIQCHPGHGMSSEMIDARLDQNTGQTHKQRLHSRGQTGMQYFSKLTR